MIQNVFAFSVVSLTLAITPGPDSLIVIRHSVRAGTRGGIDAALGASFGSLVWGIVSVAGLAAVLDASAEAYRGLRIAGAVYLIVLGLRWIRPASAASTSGAFVGSAHAGFRAGLISNLLNPKVGLFFLAVMPQFLPASGAFATYAIVLALVDALIAGVWLTSLAWMADRARSLLHRDRIRLRLERAGGIAMVAMGFRAALD